MTDFRRRCARFGKFNLVGLMGAALQLTVFDLLLSAASLPAAAAAALSVELAVIHNFSWHERFTWRDREPAGRRQRAVRLLRFHLSNGLVPVAANALLISCLVERLGAPALLSALAAIALCAPLNFLLADCWVYRAMVPPGAEAREAQAQPQPGDPALAARAPLSSRSAGERRNILPAH